MAWLYLFIAGGLEVFWSTFLKLSEGFTKLWPSVWAVAGMIASFFFLSQATKTLPMGTAYGIWTGIAPWAPSSWAFWPSRSLSLSRGSFSWGCCLSASSG